MPVPSDSFLEWFIGFFEGDGSFSIAKRSDLQFVVTESTSNVIVFNHILNTLGFGKVIVQSTASKTHRYVVQDLKNLSLLCLLFNGNLVLPIRKAKFDLFLTALNLRLVKLNSPSVTILEKWVLPTLEDSWLLGFSDAEGCFSCSLLTNSNAYRFRFILSQKWSANKPVLSHIGKLFSYSKFTLTLHSTGEDNWELRFSSLANCKGLFVYFDKFPLNSSKRKSYLLWKQLYSRLLNKDHLNSDLRAELVILSRKIN
ncbi:MAG: hypothetical protein EOP34_03155 [Rickettsiales bacterium]|nr:MAG: hypothetical protein EOP34_03155 [Rickettsiales bacterium]